MIISNQTTILPQQGIFVTTPVVQQNAIPPVMGSVFKPKKAGKNTSHIVVILDASGSMAPAIHDTCAGFNELVKTHRETAKKDNIPTYVTLITFEGRRITTVYSRMNVNEVPELSPVNYRIGGSTNLYDAIGNSLMTVNEQLKKATKEYRDSVIVTIITDGEENCSQNYTNADIKLMVSKAEEKNWGFQFIGANIDAFAVGSTLGFSTHNTLNYNTKNMQETFRAGARMSSDMKAMYAAGAKTDDTYVTATWSMEERASAVGDKNE